MYTCIHTYTPNCFRQSRRLHDALAGPDRGGQAVDLCLFYVSRTDRMKVAECLGQPHPYAVRSTEMSCCVLLIIVHYNALCLMCMCIVTCCIFNDIIVYWQVCVV